MPDSESVEPLPPPDDDMWFSINTVVDRELHGGHQSRVFAAERNGDPVVVKLVDSRIADTAFPRRIEMSSRLAEANETVVAPISSHAGLVTDLGGWLAVIYPLVEGRMPDIAAEADVRSMAQKLASLHRSLDDLDPVDLPEVAALGGTEWDADYRVFSRPQLLHGDFSRKNLLFSDRGVRVFDFDDCGYGPIEFEVGNTLYMELFDAAMSSEPLRYEHFRFWFVDEYRVASGRDLADESIDEAIRLRITALSRWIDQPHTAPIGIRSATPAWRESLRAFVQDQTQR